MTANGWLPCLVLSHLPLPAQRLDTQAALAPRCAPAPPPAASPAVKVLQTSATSGAGKNEFPSADLQ